jgi:hypothetical protein
MNGHGELSNNPCSHNSSGANGLKNRDLAAEAECRRERIKDQILAGVKDFNVEQFRKSDKELDLIKDKRVREYYEAQNQKLNDWAEVDRLVWSLADDVVDSTNPDADRDGILDRDTPLYLTGYDVEAFLPQDERDRRVRDDRMAKRFLNVGALTLISASHAKLITS